MWLGANPWNRQLINNKHLSMLTWLMLTDLVRLVTSSPLKVTYLPSEVIHMRRKYYGHQHHGGNVNNSPIHYFKLNPQPYRANLSHKKYSKMYKLPTKFVSNGKPVDIVYGIKTLKKIKFKSSTSEKVTMGNKSSRIYQLPTKYTSNAKPIKAIFNDCRKNVLYKHRPFTFSNSIKM